MNKTETLNSTHQKVQSVTLWLSHITLLIFVALCEINILNCFCICALSMNKIYSLKLMLRAAVAGLIKVSRRILGETSCNAMSLSLCILHSFFVYISCFPSVDSPKYRLARIRQKSMAPNRNPAEIYLLAPHADFSLYPLCLTSLFVFFPHLSHPALRGWVQGSFSLLALSKRP